MTSTIVAGILLACMLELPHATESELEEEQGTEAALATFFGLHNQYHILSFLNHHWFNFRCYRGDGESELPDGKTGIMNICFPDLVGGSCGSDMVYKQTSRLA